ncbi:MAG: chloride channel protein [Faecalibacterium prausnitzii]
MTAARPRPAAWRRSSGAVRHAAGGDPLRHHGGGRGPCVLGGLCARLRRRPHAYGVSLACGIAPTHFGLTAPALSSTRPFWRRAGRSLCAGVPGFCWLLHTMEHEMPRRLPNPWVRAVVGGAAVVALSYLMGVGRYNGAGMGVITAAVEQGQALPWDFICKILLTALTLSAGFKGGEVVPSFYIGATFGCAFGPLLGLPAGFSAAVGLVSVFCGATNTLIPSILLAYELFGGVGLELIALGCGVCYMLSGTHGLYSSQLFVTEKLLSEYTESWGKRLHH